MVCAFLQLPLELRLDIYDLALQQENEVTISTTLDPTYKSDIPNLPDGHRPIMVPGFDEHILSFTKFAPQTWKPPKPQHAVLQAYLDKLPRPYPFARQISDNGQSALVRPQLSRMSSYDSTCLSEAPPSPAEAEESPFALLLTCKDIRNELTEHLARRSKTPVTVHVSYPFGLFVLMNTYSALLPVVKNVNICGFHAPVLDPEEELKQTIQREIIAAENNMPVRYCTNENGPQPPSVNIGVDDEAMARLGLITQGFLSNCDSKYFKTFTLRMFFPGSNGYQQSIHCYNPWDVLMGAIEDKQLEGDIAVQHWSWRGTGGATWVTKVVMEKPRSDQPQILSANPSFESRQKEDWMGVITGARDSSCPLETP
jgi:hypothetical protein